MTAGKQLSDGNPSGTSLGQSATDLISLFGTTPAAQAAALTTSLTTIVPADAEGTPDYAIQAITSTTPFGFVNAQEAITVLYVIKNLQTRVDELETKLQALGAIA